MATVVIDGRIVASGKEGVVDHKVRILSARIVRKVLIFVQVHAKRHVVGPAMALKVEQIGHVIDDNINNHAQTNRVRRFNLNDLAMFDH